ncbi:hypothetical protein [Lysobacter gummosus]|uniref:hypothetical protein n=1 Tax=Lysobacter gummosus TaxID=262324 RepID=UPI00362C0DED
MRVLSSLTVAVLFAIAPAAFGAERPYVPVEQRFTAEQLKATGLDTLSAQQLQALNELLSQDQNVAITEAVKQVRTERKGLLDRGDVEPVTSTLKGEFRGWSSGTVLTLENGQRWRVVEGSLFLGKSVPAPKITIRPGLMGGWYLEAEGQTPKAKVKRLD